MRKEAILDETRLISSIYESVFTTRLDGFKEHGLAMLKDLIPFDSGVWASGVQRTKTLFSVTLYNYPHAAIADYAMNWQDQDFVRAAAVADPGTPYRNEDVMPLADYHRTAIYRAYSSPAGIEHALGTADADPVTTLGEMIFLFRTDKDRPFTDKERDLKARVMPSLVQAWRHRQLLQAYARRPERPECGAQDQGCAMVDHSGHIHATDAGFARLMADGFPQWRGPNLPPSLVAIIASASAEGRHADLHIRAVRSDSRVLLVVARSPLARLTPAELRVARAFAAGDSRGRIAERFSVSASTVRNQLASAYAKLGVATKIELVRLLD